MVNEQSPVTHDSAGPHPHTKSAYHHPLAASDDSGPSKERKMSASTEYSNSGEYQRRQDETNAGPSRSSSHSHSRQHSDGYHQVSASASTSRTFQDDHGHGHNLSSGPGGEESRHQDERRHSSFSATSPPPRKSASLSRPKSHHLDIATFPTQQLLRLIAGLLQHIASANDALRPDPSEDQEGIEDEGGDPAMTSGNGHSTRESSKSRSRSHSRASHTSSATHPSSSPTTALFEHRRPDGMIASDSVSASRSVSPNLSASTPALNSPDFPLFSASRSSLSHPSSLLAFHARHIPSISVEAYLLRILKYCPTTNEVFLGLLVYFDRMTRLGTPAGVGGENAGVAKGKGFAIDSYNIHRLVIAGVTVASKFFSDVFYTNSRYAKVGGLPSTELNSLELQFLLLNDFRLRISLDEMQRYGDRLLAYAAEEDEREREALASRARALKGDFGGAGPSIEDAHSASQAVATSEIVNGRSKVSHHGSTDRTEQTSIPQPASTVQPSQPALAPDHPSEANSAPITRQTSNTSATAVLSQHHKSQPSHSQTYPPPTTSAPVPSIGSIGSTAKPGKLDSESSRSGSSEWVNVVGEGQ